MLRCTRPFLLLPVQHLQEVKLHHDSIQIVLTILVKFSTPSRKEVSTPSTKKGPVPSATSSMRSTVKSSVIQCFKCLGRGHISKECPNNHTMLITEEGDYDSASEDESHANLERYEDAEEAEELEKTYGDFETGPLIVTKKVLSVQPKEDKDQRCTTIFQTKAKVNGGVCKVIIDGGSSHNLASGELCDKLGLKFM